MTLDELIQRLPVAPEKGTHEIVRAPDGLNHFCVIMTARDILENGVSVREYAFATWCGLSNVKSTDLEVVRDQSITCYMCIQWRTT